MQNSLLSYLPTSVIAKNATDDLYGSSFVASRIPANSQWVSAMLINKIIASWDSLFSTSESTSNGNKTIAAIQQPGLKSNKTVCDMALASIAELPASHHKNLAHSLLVSIQTCIMDQRQYAELTPFCPISFSEDDDGTIVLEWAYRRGRISYYIDPELEDSIAVFVDALTEDGLPKTWSTSISADRTTPLAVESIRFVSRLA